MPPISSKPHYYLVVAAFTLFIVQEYINNTLATQTLTISIRPTQNHDRAANYASSTEEAHLIKFMEKAFHQSFLVVLGEELRGYGQIKNSNFASVESQVKKEVLSCKYGESGHFNPSKLEFSLFNKAELFTFLSKPSLADMRRYKSLGEAAKLRTKHLVGFCFTKEFFNKIVVLDDKGLTKGLSQFVQHRLNPYMDFILSRIVANANVVNYWQLVEITLVREGNQKSKNLISMVFLFFSCSMTLFGAFIVERFFTKNKRGLVGGRLL